MKIDMDKQQYYLHSDDNYYWTPAAWAEYQSLKAKLEVAKAALEQVRAAYFDCEKYIETPYHPINQACVKAKEALAQLNQPMSTEDKLATAVASEDTGYV